MAFREILEAFFAAKGIRVYAFYGPSGTGKSFRAKLVAQKYGIKAIIDDGLLIDGEKILAGHSAKLEDNYMGAVRVALFDAKDHRDDIARAIAKNKIKKILILGTSEKMVNKIAMRLQLPIPEKYIKIEDIATKEQIEEARRSRQIEGKHVIPVRAYEVKENKNNYKKIFVDSIRVALAKRKLLPFGASSTEKKEEPSANDKLFEKSVVRPSFSVSDRKKISQAALARMTGHYVKQYDERIRVKGLSIILIPTGYKLVLTVDLPFGSNLTEETQKLKAFIIDMIEKVSQILIEDISIIIDRIIPLPPAESA